MEAFVRETVKASDTVNKIYLDLCLRLDKEPIYAINAYKIPEASKEAEDKLKSAFSKMDNSMKGWKARDPEVFGYNIGEHRTYTSDENRKDEDYYVEYVYYRTYEK